MALHALRPSRRGRYAVLPTTVALIGLTLTALPPTTVQAAPFTRTLSALSSGTDAIVEAVAASATTVYASGAFTTAGGTSVGKIARYDIAGGTWSAMGTFAVAPEVLAVHPTTGDVYAGGIFSNADGATNSAFIASWNGTAWSGLGDGDEYLGDRVSAIAFSPSGELYIGGSFALTPGGTGLNFVARWDAPNARWLPLGGGTDGAVKALAVDSAGNVYAAGVFTTAGGQPASRIAMWNGTTWSSLGAGLTGVSSANFDLSLDSQDNLYVAGHFNTAGGLLANNVAKWDGTAWSTLGLGVQSGVPFDIHVDSADQVYVVGGFVTAINTSDNADDTQFLARWNGTEWQGMTPLLNSSVAAITEGGTSGTLYLGGSFTGTTPATVSLNNIAALQPAPTIAAVTPARVSTAGGTPIAVTGAALKGATVAITIDGVVPDNVAPVSQGLLTADTKAHAAGPVTLTLTTPAGTATATVTYVDPPSVSAVSPSAGPVTGGTSVTITITGTDFTDVTFGGAAGTGLTIVSDTRLTVTTPAHVADLSDVVVTSPHGADTVAGAFRFAAAPSATSATPSSGTDLGGTTVTISGGAFTGATAVTFGGIPATTFTVLNDTTIEAVSPAGTGSDLALTVVGPGGSSTLAAVWDYLSPPGAPRSLKQGTKSKQALTFTWRAPSSNGGVALVGYKVQYRKVGTTRWANRSGLVTTRSVKITGLRDGTRYEVRIAAKNNRLGTYASTTATTPAVPAAPTRVRASARGKIATLTWTRATVGTGSSRLSNLLVCRKGSTSKRVTVAGAATTGRVTLGRGTWSCRVYASSEAGRGAGSKAVSITIV